MSYVLTFKFRIFRNRKKFSISRQLIMQECLKVLPFAWAKSKRFCKSHTLAYFLENRRKTARCARGRDRILPAAQISVWIRLMVIEITRNVRLLSGERLLDGHGLSGDQSWRWKFDEKQIVPPASCYFDHRTSKKFLLWLTSTWYLLGRKGYRSDQVFASCFTSDKEILTIFVIP